MREAIPTSGTAGDGTLWRALTLLNPVLSFDGSAGELPSGLRLAFRRGKQASFRRENGYIGPVLDEPDYQLVNNDLL